MKNERLMIKIYCMMNDEEWKIYDQDLLYVDDMMKDERWKMNDEEWMIYDQD
jgi:hypothetical protein